VLGLPRARRAIRETRAAAAEILAFLDLVPLAHRPVATLAYGLQKRVELARADRTAPPPACSTSRWSA
jgi:ABC-type branched-subunit amino acid transport system ATPase component